MPTSQRNQAQWTPEAISLFWEYFGERKDLHSEYFTNQLGHGIKQFLRYSACLPSDSIVLDYGCGPGFLIRHLLALGVGCYAGDSSCEAVALVNQRYAGHKHWNGAVVFDKFHEPFAKESFDLVTCIETVEHIPSAQLPSVLNEIHGLIKPGGFGLFTTPNEEDLRRSSILCPFCQTEYHKVQHLRAFNSAKIATLLRSAGFEIIFCRDLDFNEFQHGRPDWPDINLRDLWWVINRKLREVLDFILPKPFPGGRVFNYLLKPGPHLCALVRKQ